MQMKYTDFFFPGIWLIPPEYSEQLNELCQVSYAFLESPLSSFSFQ